MMHSDQEAELIWGAAAIARALNASTRRTFNLLEKGKIPAKKIDGRWVSSKKALRQIEAQILGEVVDAA